MGINPFYFNKFKIKTYLVLLARFIPVSLTNNKQNSFNKIIKLKSRMGKKRTTCFCLAEMLCKYTLCILIPPNELKNSFMSDWLYSFFNEAEKFYFPVSFNILIRYAKIFSKKDKIKILKFLYNLKVLKILNDSPMIYGIEKIINHFIYKGSNFSSSEPYHFLELDQLNSIS